MATSFKVKPVTRYKKPRYPAHTEPNPLDYPDTLPYPFSQSLLDWALAVGLLGIGACQSADKQDSLLPANTFTFDKTGLPYMLVMFGTGLPDPLSSKATREIALRICREEGLSVQEDVLWQDTTTGVAFPVSFFDQQRRIGVAVLSHWGDQANTDNSIVQQPNWRPPSTEGTRFGQWQNAWYSIQNERSASEIHEWLDLKKQSRWNTNEKRLYDLFQRAAFSEVSDDEQWFFFQMYLEKNYGAADQPVLHDRAAVQKAILKKSKSELNLALDEQDFLDKIFLLRQKEDWQGEVLTKYRSSFKTWRKEYEYEYEYSPFLVTLNRLIEILNGTERTTPQEIKAIKKSAYDFFGAYDPAWMTKLPQLLVPFHAQRFSLRELEGLDELAEQEKVFIAPVSFEDKRYNYRYSKEEISSYADKIDSTQLNKMKELSEEAAIKRLEENLRAYIRWAKHQGRY